MKWWQEVLKGPIVTTFLCDINNKRHILAVFSKNNLTFVKKVNLSSGLCLIGIDSGIPIGEMFKKNSYAIEPQTLVVFNHDGAVLGRFKLSSRSSVICLSENEEYLYIVNTDPEVQIERVRVRDILKKI